MQLYIVYHISVNCSLYMFRVVTRPIIRSTYNAMQPGLLTALLTLQGPVVTIRTTSLTFSNSTFCPHSVFVCFVWIWEQTAIISLYNINRLGFINETKCLPRGTDWIFKYDSGQFLCSKYSLISPTPRNHQCTVPVTKPSISNSLQQSRQNSLRHGHMAGTPALF